MAGSPVWKVYTSEGKYVAACHDVEAAISLVKNHYGYHAKIKWGHGLLVWSQGEDDAMGLLSVSSIAKKIGERVMAYNQKKYLQAYAHPVGSSKASQS